MNDLPRIALLAIAGRRTDEAAAKYDAAKSSIASAGIDGTVSKATLPNGEFGKIEPHMKGPNDTDYASLGYMKIDGGKLYVVTFS